MNAPNVAAYENLALCIDVEFLSAEDRRAATNTAQ